MESVSRRTDETHAGSAREVHASGPGRASMRAARAHESAFSQVYQREASSLKRLLQRLGVPSEDVDDTIQEVFFATYKRLGYLSVEQLIRPWLNAVARRIAQNHSRSRLRRSRYLELGLDMESASAAGALLPDAKLEQSETWIELMRTIASLGPAKRAVFMLAEMSSLTAENIAGELQIPCGTVKGRLRAARHEMREKLGRNLANQSPTRPRDAGNRSDRRRR